MTRFGYLADRLMQLALAAYALNRFAVLPHLAGFLPRRAPWLWQFLHAHFDDFLMMPAALPVVPRIIYGKCLYPLWGHNERPTQKFCGEPVAIAGTSWCACHRARVFERRASAPGVPAESAEPVRDVVAA